ncbi:MAG: hypothetical protein CL772_03670 [Chloroflexi bacterium]|nr:hypothetical protein [Chloroflexota bacterium]
MKKFLKISTFIISIFFLLFMKDAERISEIDKIISGQKFNLLTWELKKLPKKTIDIFVSSELTELEVKEILQKENISNKNELELFFQEEVTELIKEELGKEFLFPPLAVSLEKPPKVLIVSPRDRISQKIAILINNDISMKEIELIENTIDSLNLSSIILDTGGFAAYPSIVNIKKDYNFLISTISHEWLHHYLFFFPLGRSYFKGGDMIFINETLADLFAIQITNNKKTEESISDKFFKPFMKETREKVDKLLINNEVEMAEKYMNQRVLELNEKGYKVRKINQAYFAFYGNYGTSPSSTHNYHKKLSDLLITYDSFAEFLNEIKMIDDVNKFESLINLRTLNN